MGRLDWKRRNSKTEIRYEPRPWERSSASFQFPISSFDLRFSFSIFQCVDAEVGSSLRTSESKIASTSFL